MPRTVKKQELERRIRRGRKVRYQMEVKGITPAILLQEFDISRGSLWLALRAGKMPTLLDTIEKFVNTYQSKVQ